MQNPCIKRLSNVSCLSRCRLVKFAVAVFSVVPHCQTHMLSSTVAHINSRYSPRSKPSDSICPRTYQGQEIVEETHCSCLQPSLPKAQMMRSSSSRVSSVLHHLGFIFTIFTLRASATCYYPNGTADNTNTYLPCNPNGQSMCCQTGPAINSASVDVCRDDGFCIPSDNSGIWRRLCTDSTWKDPACISLCSTGPGILLRYSEHRYYC